METKNFLMFLGGISEDFIKKTIGIGKAKAELIKAWQTTIDASNKRNEDAAANSRPMTGGIDSYTRYQMYQDCLQMARKDARTCIP